MKATPSGIAVALALASPQVPASSHPAAAGERGYAKSCASCHRREDPKLGDKAAWKPLVAKGTDALVDAVIKGTGKMPHHAGKPPCRARTSRRRSNT